MPRGFASMTEQQRKDIASKGGKAAHRRGVAHQFTSETARAAGRKGGKSVAAKPGHMAEIGAKGGRAKRDILSRDGANQ